LRRIFAADILLILILFAFASAQWKLDPSLHPSVMHGIDLILKQDYPKADSLYRDIAKQYPNNPAGYLYQAAVLQAQAVDFDVPIDRIKFDSLLELGRKYANNIKSPWNDYFLATADGYEAYERVEHGDWFGGVRKGMSSASKYEELLEKDSTFYDAYVGIGTYYYWRSRKTAFLRWLPFVKDDRELGVNLLIIGAEKSGYNRFAAMSALVSIYLDAGEYKKAEEWSRRGIESYPENRVFLWGLATAYDRLNQNADAVQAYSNILQNIRHINFSHPYSEIVCRLNLAKCKLAGNDTVDVRAHLNIILSYEKLSFPQNLESRAQAKFDEAHKILSSLADRRSSVK
jgi:tetratricopeptide (TPR) repeat protein